MRLSKAEFQTLWRFAAYGAGHCDLTGTPSEAEAALVKRGLLNSEGTHGWVLLSITDAGRKALAEHGEGGSHA